MSVDFAGGCTGAAGQVSHWVTRARSFASWSFPRPRGAPHCDLPIKLHMCQRTLNPSESSIHVSLYVVAVLIAGNKLWQTHNITEREQRKWLMLFVYHTVRCAHTNGHIAWKCVSALGGKKWFYHSSSSVEQGETDGSRITGAAEDETRIKKNSEPCERDVCLLPEP